MIRVYSINTCPQLENPDNLELNPKQTYLPLPAEVNFSIDSEFLTIVSFDGRVNLVKMPPIIDPSSNQ